MPVFTRTSLTPSSPSRSSPARRLAAIDHASNRAVIEDSGTPGASLLVDLGLVSDEVRLRVMGGALLHAPVHCLGVMDIGTGARAPQAGVGGEAAQQQQQQQQQEEEDEAADDRMVQEGEASSSSSSSAPPPPPPPPPPPVPLLRAYSVRATEGLDQAYLSCVLEVRAAFLQKVVQDGSLRERR